MTGQSSEAAIRTRVKRLLRQHRKDLPTPENGGGGRDAMDFYATLILDQARTLYRKWPEVELSGSWSGPAWEARPLRTLQIFSCGAPFTRRRQLHGKTGIWADMRLSFRPLARRVFRAMADRNRNAKLRRRRATARNIGDMGRAAGRPRATNADATRREPSHPVAWIEKRVRPYIGIEVADHGHLAQPYGGHPAGTPYVVIRAACGMDREKARRILEPASGLPELAWEQGWAGLQLPNGEQVTELRLFPTPNENAGT